MIARRLGLAGLGLLAIVACSAVPFRQVELVPLEGVDAERLREEFAGVLPASFRIVNTVTFHFKGNSFSALGYTEVDTLAETFTVIGLHPAGGVKLFEVSGDSEQVESGFALEEFAARGDLARAVGDDTKRMYFDRLPSPDAKAHMERYRVLFRQEEGEGELEFVFAGSEGHLVQKRYYENGRKVWSASYYEYRRKHGKLYPDGIILEHHEYGYRLVVRLKEIRS
jgi:hypothetical protein